MRPLPDDSRAVLRELAAYGPDDGPEPDDDDLARWLAESLADVPPPRVVACDDGGGTDEFPW